MWEPVAASWRWQGVRAVRKGETEGFPLIIYSLSLGNQAVSTAKLSLPAPRPFEASGCLSSLSGCAAPTQSQLPLNPAGSRMSELGRGSPAHVGQPQGQPGAHAPSQRPGAAHAMEDRAAAGVVTAQGKSPLQPNPLFPGEEQQSMVKGMGIYVLLSTRCWELGRLETFKKP